MSMDEGRLMTSGKEKTRRPEVLLALILLLLLIGVGAIISGAMLFISISPDGALLGMSTDLLEDTPFSSYLVPSIVLFIFLGMFSVFAGYSLLRKLGWRWPDLLNPCKSYHWAWTAAWAEGVIILIWIAAETVFLGYITFLQPFIVGWGIVIIALALLPPIRRYYQGGNHTRA